MKITMYELLGLVKDGKAPKKIKYKDKIYYYHEGYDFNYMYNSSDYSPMDKEKSLFKFNSYKCKDGAEYWDNNAAIDFLNDEVEIPEEEKKIPEKLDIYDELQTLLANGGGSYDHNIHKMFKKIELKQNEIIDYLKRKGDE